MSFGRSEVCTSNSEADQGADLPKDFLLSLHFAEDIIVNSMIINRGKVESLKKQINNFVDLHIQDKYRDVFQALEDSKLKIEKSPVTKNLIQALAHIENRKEPTPSVSMLRALFEAFEAKVKSIYEASVTDELKTFKPALDSLETAFKPYKFKKVKHLFKPSRLTGKYCLRDYEETYRHYAFICDMIHTITSQEIHYNERPRLEGYRLELVVYGICELLLLYQKEISSNARIECSQKHIDRVKILNIADYINRGKDGWMSIGTLKQFSKYLDGIKLEPNNLEDMGFEINKEKKYPIQIPG